MQLYVICLMQLNVLYALDVFWSNLMFIKNRTCVKNQMGGGGGAKIFDMEFGGVFKIKSCCWRWSQEKVKCWEFLTHRTPLSHY